MRRQKCCKELEEICHTQRSGSTEIYYVVVESQCQRTCAHKPNADRFIPRCCNIKYGARKWTIIDHLDFYANMQSLLMTDVETSMVGVETLMTDVEASMVGVETSMVEVVIGMERAVIIY